MTGEIIQYAFRVDATRETPCHLSEIKRGDVFYQVNGNTKSELYRATGDAFSSDVNGNTVWSIPHELYQ